MTKWRFFTIAAISVILLSVGAVIVVITSAQQQFYAPGPHTTTSFFEIERGAAPAHVAASLAEAGLIATSGPIPAPLIFREGARRTERAQIIRFGTFEIPAGASMDRILEIITDAEASKPRFRITLVASINGGRMVFGERQAGSLDYVERAVILPGEDIREIATSMMESGSSVDYRVVIPEGLTSWQVVESLKLAAFLAGDDPVIPPEGSLAPDTYSVARGLARDDLLARMAQAQSRIVADNWSRRSQDLPIENPQEALILASIIEKETGLADERGLVASVFVNRLRKDMPLQTDPSVIYGLTDGKAPLGRGLRKSELERDTPYNTYLHPGLPPGPIANPGRQSIQAAVNPDHSDYLYFVADGTGGHAFAKTYQDHRVNVRAWRKIEAGN
ncbi:MAG: endolytic transglycosylase MltG [Rhodobacteraceae bacterium]|nr:endolytic transglycosylase MltG [Paracoccaceae bacterium]